MESIEKKMFERIVSKKHQWVFSEIDFRDIASDAAIRQSFARLTKRGAIRRLCPGLYDRPRFSNFLNQAVSPDLNHVADALARKFGWRIQSSGEAALNFFGLSTQIEGQTFFFSDGPNREYHIGKQILVFKKILPVLASLRLQESKMIVQAIEAISPARFDADTAKKIRSHYDRNVLEKVLQDTRGVKRSLYECVREICSGEE